MNYSLIVLNGKNITDFAGERNRLLNKADEDWVLFVDSDEIVTDELSEEIGRLPPKGFNGYYVKRRNYFLGKVVGVDKIVRLGRKDAGRWVRAVHEIWQIAPPLGRVENYLNHNTADGLYDYVGKINRYSSLHATANGKEGKRSTLFKIIFYPLLKFLQTLLKSKHAVFSIMQAFHSFLSWSKLYISQTQK